MPRTGTESMIRMPSRSFRFQDFCSGCSRPQVFSLPELTFLADDATMAEKGVTKHSQITSRPAGVPPHCALQTASACLFLCTRSSKCSCVLSQMNSCKPCIANCMWSLENSPVEHLLQVAWKLGMSGDLELPDGECNRVFYAPLPHASMHLCHCHTSEPKYQLPCKLALVATSHVNHVCSVELITTLQVRVHVKNVLPCLMCT